MRLGRDGNDRRGRSLGRVAAKALCAVADPLYGPLTGPRILIYHQVGAGIGREMEVTADCFERQMAWLAERYDVVSLDHALESRGLPGADRQVVITFDDGYADMYRHAFPVLEAHGFPLTLYLATEPVETGRPLYPDARATPVRWRQVEEMLSSGLMTLGAHTHRHVDLHACPVDVVEREIERSNRVVAERTGAPPRHFAYPWGSWSAEAESLVKRAYVSAALGSGPPVDADTDPYRIHRIPVQLSDGFAFFRRKLETGLRAEDRLRRLVRRYGHPTRAG